MSRASDFQILIVEDDESSRNQLKGFLIKKGYRVVAVEDGETALNQFSTGSFDLVLTDFKMPGMDGLQLLHELKRRNPETVVVILTAHGTEKTAVAAMKEGAYDYLTKPIQELDELLLLIHRAEREAALERENRQLKDGLREKFKDDSIISSSKKMEEALNLVGRVGPSQATVLILGESGTGKELFARAIHYASPRAEKSLIKVNCAALPENLLESELFGHEKGAFTGAVARRIGRFEQADQGSIFLDEIGDLSPALQAKLLRVLQEKEIERVGSNQTLKIDVRMIAATNRNLEEAIRKGTFREDLYYRLNVVTISLPPLRERKEDIPLLIDYFLKKYNTENKKEVRSLSRESKDLLLKYEYPGNVRELENIIERAVVLCRGEMITSQDLPLSLRESKTEIALDQARQAHRLPESIETLERQLIIGALERSGGIQTRAAEELGINERVLRYKMKKYKIAERE
ncbi:MAG: response regulator containing CheY-like receiver, AAA-type ATPase, and DNA-binding domain [Deltaproteobacteria bacterium]|nr:response regulator containing CheY-like receiver, AAA-type ATPase, and DNA-binding domain [Deltaproteobacteria bacterium]